jgi:hypothetical protein
MVEVVEAAAVAAVVEVVDANSVGNRARLMKRARLAVESIKRKFVRQCLIISVTDPYTLIIQLSVHNQAFSSA